MHAEELTQETPVREPVTLPVVGSTGLGLGTIDQVEPFQDSTRVPTPVPTAVHAVGLKHETAASKLFWVGDVSGLGTIDQVEPFHDSMSVWLKKLALKYSPTAMHFAGPVQATPARTSIPEALGLETIDHVDPLRTSIRVWMELLLAEYSPTAVQAVGLMHDTPLSRLS